MSFALVLILGGGPPVQTLETELYARLRYGSLDMGGAVSCAFWQLLITLAPWALVLVFKSKQPALISLSSTRRPKKSSGGLGLLLAMTGMFFLIPYFAVINSQLIKIISVGEWREQISAPLRLSLALAFYSSLGAVATAFLGVLSLRAMKRWPVLKSMTEILIGIPGGISVLVLSLGVWLAYGKWFDPFEGSFLAMVALQTTLFFPVAFRIFWPLSQSLRLRELEAAVSLGASEFSAFWWVEFPRWRGPILSALAAVAGASLGEVGAVSLFYSEKLIPLPLLVSRWMEQYHFEEAQGIAGLLFLLSSFLIVGSLEAGNKFSTS
jgi:thiamine transport system permease protein